MSGRERQKQLAREHYERQTKRRIEHEAKVARAKRIALIGTSVVGVLAVAGVIVATNVFGGSDTTATADPAPSESTSEKAAEAGTQPTAFDPAGGTCGYVASEGGATKDVGLPPAKVDKTPTTMTLKTNQGDIVIKVAADKTPCTVNSFAFLAQKKYFDGSKCHRLGSDQFPMLQCGDPLAKADGKARPTARAAPATAS